MSRLPPAEKLPLAVRKDLRDNWEAKLPELEKQLSDLLGESWSVKIDPLAIWPYGEEGSYAKVSLGKCLKDYIEGAIYQLKYFVSTYGDEGKEELNTIASARTITLDLDENKKFSYCGPSINDKGELVILFAPGNLAVNVSSACEPNNITKALNDAPPPSNAKALNYNARSGISREYKSKIGEVQKRLNEILKTEVTLDPNFEDVFAKLEAAKVSGDWDKNLGSFTRYYFEALNKYLTYEKFDKDDMLQEGLLGAIDKKKVVFRIVDKLVKGSYNEPLIEDGILYLQTTPDKFGTNVADVASGLVDLL